MFNIVKLCDNVLIKALDINENIRETLRKELINNYEGKVIPKIDHYIIKILDINTDIKYGLINDINGDVFYKVEYIAITFDPVNNSIFNVKVKKINDLAIWSSLELFPEANIECICSSNDLLDMYNYDADNMSYVLKNDSKNVIKLGSTFQFQIINKQIECSKIVILGKIYIKTISKTSSLNSLNLNDLKKSKKIKKANNIFKTINE